MKWNEVISTNYLSKDYVGEDGMNLTIQKILNEKIGGKGQDREVKPIVHFQEDGTPPMVLNKTNVKRLRHFFPDTRDTSELKGEIINVYFDPTIEFAGKITGGLRIRQKS